jgi:CheY-like chemotaxis protein
VPAKGLILLVEDSEDDAFFFMKTLGRSGLGNPLRRVDDGAKALAYLERQYPYINDALFPLPSIMLVDLGLHELDGWEVLKAVRTRREFDKLLVVVLTGSLRVEDIRRAYDLGANSFLNKPCSPEDLRNLASAFPEHWSGLNALGFAGACKPLPATGGLSTGQQFSQV